jgi:peroxiredoxin
MFVATPGSPDMSNRRQRFFFLLVSLCVSLATLLPLLVSWVSKTRGPGDDPPAWARRQYKSCTQLLTSIRGKEPKDAEGWEALRKTCEDTISDLEVRFPSLKQFPSAPSTTLTDPASPRRSVWAPAPRPESLAEGAFMDAFWLASTIALWALVLFLGFLLLGALRVLGLLRWRLEELEATTPNRAGRSGLAAGKKAPDFTLPSTAGGAAALHDFARRKLLLVFIQAGCAPCQAIVPELNRLAGTVPVLAVCRGDAEATRRWAVAAQPRFPVLVQERFAVSRQYEVYATPFAFLIDEQGVIRSKGIIGNKQYLGYVLAGTNGTQGEHTESKTFAAEEGASEELVSHSHLKEVRHV